MLGHVRGAAQSWARMVENQGAWGLLMAMDGLVPRSARVCPWRRVSVWRSGLLMGALRALGDTLGLK